MSLVDDNQYVQMIMFVLNSLGSSQIAQISILIFLGCCIWVRAGGRKNKYLSLQAVQNAGIVAVQYFQLRSRSCKMHTLEVFRWAATNYGVKSFYRDFRFSMYFKPRQHIKYLLTSWCIKQEDTFHLQLTIQPKYELYCSIVNNKCIQQYKNQNQALLSAFSDIKQRDEQFQMCESCNGLIDILKPLLDLETLLSFTVDNNQLLLHVTSIQKLQYNTQRLFKIAEVLKNIELSDQQSRQNKKSVEQKQKFEKQMAAQLRIEKEEDELYKKIEDIHIKLMEDDVPEQEKKALEAKLKQYKTKLQEKAQKAYAKELGLGGMFGNKKGNKSKNIIVRK